MKKEIKTLVVESESEFYNEPAINEVGAIKINLEGRLVDAEVLGMEVEQAYSSHPLGSPDLQSYPTANLVVRGNPAAIGCELAQGVIPYLYLHVLELDKTK